MEKVIETYLQKYGFKEFDPRVALFDMDGVLYDSMRNHARAWHDSMSLYGLEMSEEDAYVFEGMKGVETIKIVTGRQWDKEATDEEAINMYKVKSEHYAACPIAEIIPGVRQLQEKLKNNGLKIGVVTGSGQPSLLDRIMSDFGGLVSPEIMVTALNIKRGKPAPDPYLKGMELAETEPWQTIVVENAPLGVRAAVAARAFTVAVNTGPLPDSALANEGADIVFHTMDEFASWLK